MRTFYTLLILLLPSITKFALQLISEKRRHFWSLFRKFGSPFIPMWVLIKRKTLTLMHTYLHIDMFEHARGWSEEYLISPSDGLTIAKEIYKRSAHSCRRLFFSRIWLLVLFWPLVEAGVSVYYRKIDWWLND